MLGHLLLFLFSFIGIWVGSGLAVASVEKISHSLKLSSFAVAFLVLGIFTSLGEFSVGVNSLVQNDPEIYVGNLIGASIVIFLLIIPLLVITENKVRINPELQGFNLALSLIVVATPVILSFDGRVDWIDGIISIILCFLLVLMVQKKRGFFEEFANLVSYSKIKLFKLVLKIAIGVVIIFISSYFIVEQTEYFSELLGLSQFLLSMLLVAIGTNLPEISFLVRSWFIHNNQVAFGDYIGSAAINTGLFGFFTLVYGKPVLLSNSYLVSLLFLIVGLIAFYLFARSKNVISRLEGIILLIIYALFVATEVWLHS